jgi:SAM-dependent methyltransferase
MNLLSKYETRRRLLKGLSDFEALNPLVSNWFHTPQGEAVFAAEKGLVEPILSHLFGYHILQVGCSEEYSLIESSPAGQKILFSPAYRPGAKGVVANNEELPLATDSIDVVVVHHALDFTQDSHKLLREVTRVVRPGGHLLIIGFNPYSSWGLLKLFKRKVHIPWRGRFISKRRVSDWLKLLDLHIESVQFGLHFLPLKFSKILRHAMGMEKLGNKFNSPFGGAYVILCTKQVFPLTPIIPRWRTLRTRPSAIPAAESIRAKIH